MVNWFLYWSAKLENLVLVPIIVLLVGIVTYNNVFIELKEFEKKGVEGKL